MAVNSVDFRRNKSTNTDRNPSAAIWADCEWDNIRNGIVNGIAFHDDFDSFPLIGTQTTEIGFDKYKVFATSGSTVAPVSTINSVEKAGGFLKFATDTDNDSASLAQASQALIFSGLTSNSGKAWVEARIALKSLLTNMNGFFFGLAETDLWTLATGVPFNGGDAITNGAAAIGFRKEEDGLGVVDSVYSDRATGFTNIGDAEATFSAAYTFMKLGMLYDPTDSAKCVRFFADGVEMTTPLTKAALVALTNLDANALGLIFATVADSAGTTAETYLDWWRYAQLLP